MINKLIVALDVSSLKEAQKLVKTLSPLVRIFKIGKELFTSCGPDAIEMVHAYKGKVFLDLKFHDIPHTVQRACEAASRLGVFMLNVHTLGGRSMMRNAVEGTRQREGGSKTRLLFGERPLVVGVTVLTSLARGDLKELGIGRAVKTQVAALAKLAQECGLDGVVASGHEIALIRKATGKKFLIVTPGVRPLWASEGQDQKRITTPKKAIEEGADFIVVGRPITEHPKPLEAAQRILEEIS